MHRQILEACLPWLLLLAAAFAGLRLVVRLSGARCRWGRLIEIHSCQAGSVQSLSFVLTLPLFILIVLFILQISQLMVGITVVHYAAFAAARAASVWIPAETAQEPANQLVYAPTYNGTAWEVDQLKSNARLDPPGAGTQHPVLNDQTKYGKIWWAAVLACAPISPSRNLSSGSTGHPVVDSTKAAYAALAPSAANNPRIAQRIQIKLAYSSVATVVWINGTDKDNYRGPTYNPRPGHYVTDRLGNLVWIPWNPAEIGWEDPLTLTVAHNFALLPGPARWLATQVTNPNGTPDFTSQRVSVLAGGFHEKVYTTVLTARATMSNEGFKSVIPYVQPAN